MAEFPHIQMPFTRNATGKVNVVEQDTLAHIQSQEWAVATCPVGLRPERQDFGWPWPEMAVAPIDPQPLIDALNRLVPGPVGRTASAYMSLADPSTWNIEVDDNVAGGQ